MTKLSQEYISIWSAATTVTVSFMALEGMNAGLRIFQGKAATTELPSHPPVIPGISTRRALLVIFMKDDKGSYTNQHDGAVTTQDLPGRIIQQVMLEA